MNRRERANNVPPRHTALIAVITLSKSIAFWRMLFDLGQIAAVLFVLHLAKTRESPQVPGQSQLHSCHALAALCWLWIPIVLFDIVICCRNLKTQSATLPDDWFRGQFTKWDQYQIFFALLWTVSAFTVLLVNPGRPKCTPAAPILHILSLSLTGGAMYRYLILFILNFFSTFISGVWGFIRYMICGPSRRRTRARVHSTRLRPPRHDWVYGEPINVLVHTHQASSVIDPDDGSFAPTAYSTKPDPLSQSTIRNIPLVWCISSEEIPQYPPPAHTLPSATTVPVLLPQIALAKAHSDERVPTLNIEPNAECSICWNKFTDSPAARDESAGGQLLRVLGCGHMFHMTCVDRWLLEDSGSCPLCRRKVVGVDRNEECAV